MYPALFGLKELTEEEKKQEMDKIFNLYKEMNEILSNHLYLANDNLTIADVQIYNEVYQNYSRFNYDLSEYPNVKDWISRMEEDSVIQELNELMKKRMEEMMAKK